jgi:hypothetical protein
MIGARFPAGAENFSLPHRVQTGSGAHPASHPMGSGALSLWIKWPGSEADHSTPSNAEVKNAWSYASTPPSSWRGAYLITGYNFMAWYLVKPKDNFTFFGTTNIHILPMNMNFSFWGLYAQ